MNGIKIYRARRGDRQFENTNGKIQKKDLSLSGTAK